MAPAEMKELLIIGAGPHSLTCLLRLLEPDADFSVDDKKRRAASVKTVRARCAKQRASAAYRAALTVILLK